MEERAAAEAEALAGGGIEDEVEELDESGLEAAAAKSEAPENAVADGMVDEAETQEETAGMEDDETITNEDEIMLDDATTLDDGIELDETNTLDEELAAIAATADAGSKMSFWAPSSKDQ